MHVSAGIGRATRRAVDASCDVGGALAVGEQSIVADAVQALGQYVHQKAPNKLVSCQRSGKPARHIGAIAFILGSVALAERRLLIGNYDNVKKEPDQRAVAEEMPVSE